MNKKAVLFVMAVMFLMGLNVWAEEAAPTAQADAAMAAKMEEMKKLGAPGENHKALDALVGKWNTSVKWWMSPESKPEESQGTSDNHWILGGRFVQEDFKGTSMGQPFEGMGLMGYDNIRAEYTSLWLDNMATGIMTGTGQYDAATKTFTKNATMSCPMTGEKNRAMRSVCKIVDNDHFTLEMYMNDKDGKEFKAMEIRYVRAA